MGGGGERDGDVEEIEVARETEMVREIRGDEDI
jgi:hypothetical protein